VFFANLVENLDNFQTQGFGRQHSACLDTVDDTPFWPIVLHISRVWSTIVSYLGASVQNVRLEEPESAPHLCCIMPSGSRGEKENLNGLLVIVV